MFEELSIYMRSPNGIDFKYKITIKIITLYYTFILDQSDEVRMTNQ
jgi:hypothetical protein